MLLGRDKDFSSTTLIARLVSAESSSGLCVDESYTNVELETMWETEVGGLKGLERKQRREWELT